MLREFITNVCSGNTFKARNVLTTALNESLRGAVATLAQGTVYHPKAEHVTAFDKLIEIEKTGKASSLVFESSERLWLEPSSAREIVSLYNTLNFENQRIFEQTANRDLRGLLQLQSFAQTINR